MKKTVISGCCPFFLEEGGFGERYSHPGHPPLKKGGRGDFFCSVFYLFGFFDFCLAGGFLSMPASARVQGRGYRAWLERPMVGSLHFLPVHALAKALEAGWLKKR
ncbi:MAG: hypothetical protein ABIM40_10695 [Pseudomonadota bacterium]